MPICCAGRKDGSYQVIKDETMEKKGEGVECDTKELAILVLDCCLMLDNDGHNAGVAEVAACSPLLHLLGQEQLNTSSPNANEEEEGREEGGEEEEGHWKLVKQAVNNGNVEVGRLHLKTISSADQKAEVS